jgi:hypothetical protein
MELRLPPSRPLGVGMAEWRAGRYKPEAPTDDWRGRYVMLDTADTRFGCSPRTLHSLIASGELTGYRFGDFIIRVDPDEPDSLLRPIPAVRRSYDT